MDEAQGVAGMKIYLAGSWKNETTLLRVACELREDGHEVDLFCDASTGRSVFSFAELGKDLPLNQFQAQNNPAVKKAFQEDKSWIERADAVVLVLPSGKSAHLEAGYAKGLGKKLFIFGYFEGLDVMYGFADALAENIETLKAVLHQ